jgi:thiol-disulfide isomerase/thioredoxin
MRAKIYWVIAGVVTVIAVGVLVFLLTEQTATTPAETAESTLQNSDIDQALPTASDETQTGDGRYVAYDSELVGGEGYTETILFFYAPWCPECRAFDGEISAADVPEGTQVLRVDYDSSQDLRKEYGVTTQTTFVKVDPSGKKQSLWVGYGRTKTLDAVLENT